MIFKRAINNFLKLFKHNKLKYGDNFCTKSSLADNFKIALIQMNVTKDKSKNIQKAAEMIIKSKEEGASVVCLPEMFIMPYTIDYFPKYAESVMEGPTCKMLSKIASEQKIYLVGGSLPERNNNMYYNTCTVWDTLGQRLMKYRKLHLREILIKQGKSFKESETVSPGQLLGVFNIGDVIAGVGICFDIRFDELAKIYRIANAKILFYPSTFDMTTGPIHWQALQVSRAIDTQSYVVGISQARNKEVFEAYSHSQVTDPWGKIIAQAGHGEEILYCDIDFTICDNARKTVPIFELRRTDIYNTSLIASPLSFI